MNSFAECLIQNKDKIGKGFDIIGDVSAFLADTMGQFHPILEAVFRVSYEIFSKPGQEADYMTEQLNIVNQKLGVIQAEQDQILQEQQRSSLNKQNFEWERQILSQYDKLQDFFNAKPNLKTEKIDDFLTTCKITGYDINLDSLYNAVTDPNPALLEKWAYTETYDKVMVLHFCTKLMTLFIKGLIALKVCCIYNKNIMWDEKKWHERMEEVLKRMNAVVKDIIENFAKRAKEEIEINLKEEPGRVHKLFTEQILKTLEDKYDWVSWSIRVFNDKERIFFFNWLAGKKYHGSEGGANYFEVMTKNNIKVVISFSVGPKLINTDLIKEQIDGHKQNRNMMDVAQVISRRLPNCLVHAVSYYKTVVETNNFPTGCYYHGQHQKAHLYIHPN